MGKLRGIAAVLRGLPLPAPKPIAGGLFLATLVLWWYADWTWWVLLPLLLGSVIVRLVLPLFFAPWTAWNGHLVLAGVLVFLAAMTTGTQLLVAAGVVVLSLAWGLRLASPKWLPWVALGVGLALGLGGALTEFVHWANNRARQAHNEQVDREYRTADMRPETGADALHSLLKEIAYDQPQWVCWLFDDRGRAEFTAAADAQTCEEATHTLHEQIPDGRVGDFGGAEVLAEDIEVSEGRGTVYVDACELYVLDGFDHVPAPPPGPDFGQLTLTLDPQFRLGYLITGFTPCGEDVSGKPAPTSTRPPVLPSYAPGFGTMLAKAFAERDTDVCQYFTPAGAREFAAAVDAADCAAAVELRADQVQDPTTYANPSDGATSSTGADGRTVVDACRLEWTKFGQGAVTPGPQVGYLTLKQAEPGTPGYLIDGYRGC